MPKIVNTIGRRGVGEWAGGSGPQFGGGPNFFPFSQPHPALLLNIDKYLIFEECWRYTHQLLVLLMLFRSSVPLPTVKGNILLKCCLYHLVNLPGFESLADAEYSQDTESNGIQHSKTEDKPLFRGPNAYYELDQDIIPCLCMLTVHSQERDWGRMHEEAYPGWRK